MKKILCIILALGCLQGCKETPKPQKPVVEHVGVRTIGYQDEVRGRPVIVEFWHPTEQEGPIDLPQDIGWVHPEEIRNVSIADGKHPLIIMSHGNGGERRDSSWLAEHLVKQGYIVASVEHYGNSYSTYNAGSSLRFWDRSLDISFALDRLLEEPFLENKIDRERVGFIGYSLGGMTGLSLAGATAKNVEEVARQLQKVRKEISAELVEQADFSEAYKDLADTRIKAIALIFPATFVYPAEGLKSIKTPVAMIASEGDEVLPFKDHAMKLITEKVPAKFKILKEKISHYVPLNRVSEQGKQIISKEVQTEIIQEHRLKFHKEIALFVSDFFEEELEEKNLSQ